MQPPKGSQPTDMRTTDENILDLNILVSVCVHVCMWRGVHVPMCLWRPRLSLRSSSDIVFSFLMGPLSGLELAMWYRLLSPSPQFWDYKNTVPSHTFLLFFFISFFLFLHRFWEPNSSLCVSKTNALPTKLSPQALSENSVYQPIQLNHGAFLGPVYDFVGS